LAWSITEVDSQRIRCSTSLRTDIRGIVIGIVASQVLLSYITAADGDQVQNRSLRGDGSSL
jgi:hypothetical protein